MNLPLSYGLLLYVQEPWLPFAVGVGISLLMGFLRMFTFRRLYPFSIRRYFMQVYIPVCIVSLLAWGLGQTFLAGADNFWQLAGNSAACVFLTCGLIFLLGLSKAERQIVGRILPVEKIMDKLKRKGA